MIRKKSFEGIGYSVVELNEARHVFAAAVPRQTGSLAEEARDALQTIQAVMEEQGTCGSIVHQAVFFRKLDQLEDIRKIIHDFYGRELPATSYIPQPPCNGKLLAIEALGVGRASGGVLIRRITDQVVVTSHDGITWTHCANIVPETDCQGVYDRSLDAFARMRCRLTEQGVPFENIVRTWLYLGDIVGPEGNTQRYIELNRARTEFFKDTRFLGDFTPPGLNGSVYPASTGIGTEGRNVIMGCIGITVERDGIVILPLENPKQTSAFDYGCEYGLKSPKFARAMAVAGKDAATVFVSGTASITNSETQHVGDPGMQTEQTLDNIAALIGADNFESHGIHRIGATLADLAFVRVYVKNQADYAVVREVCERRLGELPAIYAIGDVCRPDLLVEIEGIAFASSVAVS
ncbi:MAG: Rid family hydrolase [Thermoguttaceae bacterium]